ncbi:hypothetical protein [Aquirufa sp. Wall-65K1]
MESLEKQIEQLEKNLAYMQVRNEQISKGSVGWHIEHSLLVIISIVSALKKSDIDTYRWVFNWKRAWVFFTQKFPRGRVKAPLIVDPSYNNQINDSIQANPIHVSDQESDQQLSDIQAQIAKVYQLVEEMKMIPPNAYFHHFIFGDLNLADTHYFLRIHTHHHLKIMADLINDYTKTGQ